MLLLGEVAHNVCHARVALAQDVEEEEVDVVVERLVVQEQLGQVAQVLAVGLGMVEGGRRRREEVSKKTRACSPSTSPLFHVNSTFSFLPSTSNMETAPLR